VKSTKVVSLSDVASFTSGGTPSRHIPTYFEGDTPWITGADINAHGVITPRSFITDEAILKSATNPVGPGTVLLVTRTNVGKVAIADRRICFSQDITALKPDSSQVDSTYLVHFLRSQQERLAANARGATIKGIPREVLARLQVPIPSQEEQRRIARTLDRAEVLRAKRRQALAHLDDLAQCIFLNMFGDPGGSDQELPIRTIGSLLVSATYGSSQKAGHDGDLPILRMNNITSTGSIDLSDLKYVRSHDIDDRHIVQPGDVLFNRTNSAELVGKSAIFRNAVPMAYAGYLIRLRVNDHNHPEYLSTFLNTAYAKRVLRGMCKSIIGMANINAQELQKIKIPQPPLTLQSRFADNILAIEDLKATQRAHAAELDGLFAGLRDRAFAGLL
jgi:type I restriction enzyme S subunit